MSSNDHQVSINLENLSVDTATNKTGEIEVDGGHTQRHRSHGNHNNEYDASDRQPRRHRRRSRSRSPSPARNQRKNSNTNPPHLNERTAPTLNLHDVEPLLNTEPIHKVKHTELEEEESSEPNVTQGEHNPGVDDGFFVGIKPVMTEGPANDHHHSDEHPHHGYGPNGTVIPFPYSPGFNPNVILDAAGNPQVIPDINVYQQKKNLAQGMMDLALLSANANQLRYVLESYQRHPYYWFSLISISVSLILQVAVGIGLIMNSRYNVKNKEQICLADRINNFTVMGIFLITAVNVFIAAFGVADPDTTT